MEQGTGFGLTELDLMDTSREEEDEHENARRERRERTRTMTMTMEGSGTFIVTYASRDPDRNAHRMRKRKERGEGASVSYTLGGEIKRMRTRNMEDSIPLTDTIGGVPPEIAHRIMSFTGLRSALLTARTSRTHRALLASVLMREDRPYKIMLGERNMEPKSESFLLDRDCVFTIKENGIASINDVRLEDNPIGRVPRCVWIPRIVEADDGRFYMAKGYALDEIRITEERSVEYRYMTSIGRKMLTIWNHTQYGTIAMTDYLYHEPGDKHGNGDRHGTGLVYVKKGTKHHLWFFHKMIYASFLDDETIIVAMYKGKTYVVALLHQDGSEIWNIDIGKMHLECACMIFNGMVLFSVTYPMSTTRTVFLIERGPIVEDAFHLDMENDGMLIKRIAYERGMIVMILGKQYNISYDKIIALDVLYGTRKEWKMKSEATRKNITQAEGLRLLIGVNYVHVLTV